MRKDYYENSKDYINRWVVSYADFVTMLLALFMVMFAISGMDSTQTQNLQNSFKQTFSSATIQNTENTPTEVVNDANTKDKTDFLPPDDIINVINQGYNFNTIAKLIKDERGVIIRIDDNMIFDSGSAIINTNAKSSLDKIAEFLQNIDNPIIIEGHTDSSPIKSSQFPSNWELSTARATNIINYLASKYKINPQRMSAVGYGEQKPIATNATEEGRILNRRVDIVILGKKTITKNKIGD